MEAEADTNNSYRALNRTDSPGLEEDAVISIGFRDTTELEAFVITLKLAAVLRTSMHKCSKSSF